jgi:hypothetical protein
MQGQPARAHLGLTEADATVVGIGVECREFARIILLVGSNLQEACFGTEQKVDAYYVILLSEINY